jgi:hypothetical protein
VLPQRLDWLLDHAREQCRRELATEHRRNP